MALQLFEGFETIDVTTGSGTASALSEYLHAIGCQGVFTQGASLRLATSADGSHYAMSFGDTSTASNNYVVFPLASILSVGDTLVIGFRMKTPNSSRTWELIHCYDRDNNLVFKLGVNTTSTFTVYRGSTSLATSAAVLSQNTWYYVELKWTLHDTTGAYDLVLDGTSILSATGTDTKDASADDMASFRFRGTTAATGDELFIDDIYALDGSGTANNDFLGDVIVRGYSPDADGSLNQWTPSVGSDHYAVVDDTPLDDTDYLESSTTGQDELFSMSNCTMTGIKGVMAQAFVAVTLPTVMSAHVQAVSGVTTEDGTSQAVANTEPVVLTALFETDPDTSTAWDSSGVNAAQFGVELD